MMRYNQSVGFCRYLKAFVVIGIAPASVLDAVLVAVQVDHFVEQSSGYVLYRPRQCSSSDIQLMRSSKFGKPGVFTEREMPISSGRGLNGDGRS